MKNIAIIAHDKLKPLMVDFIKDRKGWIPDVKLLATGRTAEFLENAGIDVEHLSPGKTGGYRQIIDKIYAGQIDIVIFFRDADVADHHDDIADLMYACVKSNIPFASNFVSAELLILGLMRKEVADKYKNKRAD